MIGVQELASDKNILAATNSYYFSYVKAESQRETKKLDKIRDYGQKSFM